jgi:hypothetical protein
MHWTFSTITPLVTNQYNSNNNNQYHSNRSMISSVCQQLCKTSPNQVETSLMVLRQFNNSQSSSQFSNSSKSRISLSLSQTWIASTQTTMSCNLSKPKCNSKCWCNKWWCSSTLPRWTLNSNSKWWIWTTCINNSHNRTLEAWEHMVKTHQWQVHMQPQCNNLNIISNSNTRTSRPVCPSK